MEIQIKCFNKSLNTCIYSVCIYDVQNKLVYHNQTSPSGSLSIQLPYGIYKIIVMSIWGKICKTVLVNSNLCNIIPFVFQNAISTSEITFTLMDQHYKDLPIRKGVITLWHNM